MREDKKLKLFLVLQSFCPLFLLIFIRHVGHIAHVIRFFSSFFPWDWAVMRRAWRSNSLGDVIITMLCMTWFLMTVIIARGFKNLQDSGYDHYGEMIVIDSEKKDSGVTFLFTFILPLLVDDVSTLRGFIFFIVLLTMVISLLIRSDLFYQNPVLNVLGYKSYEFQFINPYQDVKKGKTYFGLSKGRVPLEDTLIKRKYIADDVFLIYNE